MESLQPLAIAVINKLFDILAKKRLAPNSVARQKMAINLEQHLIKVQNWSKRIQFAGMSAAESTDESTVSLTLDALPRRFAGAMVQSKKLSESDLLDSSVNYLIMGAPGSGKTTTLKRLARIILLHPPVSTSDLWQYPIVLRLREAKSGFSVCQLIADELGIQYRTREHEVFDKATYHRALEEVRTEWQEGKLGPLEIKEEASGWAEELARRRATKIVEEAFVGDKRLDQLLPNLLDETSAIVLLDGLDEVIARDRLRVKEEIAALAMNLSRSKIIVTTRSGEVSFLEGFNIVEICPLDEAQVSFVASKWLEEPNTFLAKLRAAPFRDLANRPLFLTHLIIFYRTKGYLPEQASDTYQKVVTLILEEWDSQREIRRGTKYAGFSPEKKLEFLAFVAFHLTYKLNLKTFYVGDLVEVYEKGCGLFNLPRDQAREVAAEIETHTGLIAEAPDAAYEFSHLSLQEYLCAYYWSAPPYPLRFILTWPSTRNLLQ